MKASIRIGNGAGFWGDNLDAPIRLAEEGRLDVLSLEYLAELTLSILAHQRRKDPDAGFVSDFPETLARLIPVLRAQPDLRIVTNAGGLNPLGCARACARVLGKAGHPDMRVGWASGDDILPRMEILKAGGEAFRHFDSGESPDGIRGPFVSANAYLGARAIADALAQDARIVITGRVADASLTVGPAMHAFGWAWDDWDLLAAASVAGHLIECGAQVTGGLLSRWRTVREYDRIGYPIAELDADGGILITKPEGTGGVVSRESVSEQLIYEIGDPHSYHTPDVTVDFAGVEMEEVGRDRVAVRGAKGRPPPETYKVSCAYANGHAAKGDLLVCGSDAVEKARAAGGMIIDLRAAGAVPEAHHIEILGLGSNFPGSPVDPKVLREVVLRVAVRDPDRKKVERFCREFSPLVTSGPPGIAGYAGGRPQARPVLSYWPTTIRRDKVQPAFGVTVADHLAEDCDNAFFEALELRR
jgi:hypothetical protein